MRNYIFALCHSKRRKESVNDKIEMVLEKHSINFEYEKDSGEFTVFG